MPYLVAEEIEPERLGDTRRKDIEDAAAKRELAGLAHGFGPAVAGMAQELDQLVDVGTAALGKVPDRGLEHLPGRQALQRTGDGGDDDAAAGGHGRRRQPGQRVDAAGDDLRIRRYPVIGKAVPGRNRHRLDLRREERERLAQPGKTRVVARDVQDRPAGPGPDQAGDQPGIDAFRDPADLDAAGDAEFAIEIHQSWLVRACAWIIRRTSVSCSAGAGSRLNTQA